MDKQEFIDLIAPAAVEDMMETGVLASITIAQAALESAWLRSAPGNNLFGVKGKGQTQSTLEEINGQMVRIEAGFAVYDSWLDSIRGHSTFLLVNPRYAAAGFFKACANLDFGGAATALQKAGYATDSHYADKLRELITQNKLYLFDKEARDNMKKLDDLAAQVATLTSASAAKTPPEWAKASVDKAVKAKIIATPVTGTADFYRLLVILDRAGLIK